MTDRDEIKALQDLLDILKGSNTADPDEYKTEIEKLQTTIDKAKKGGAGT